MEEHSGESPLHQSDVRSAEGVLRALWEKARHAGELIAQLREEKKDLQAAVQDLQQQIHQLQEELVKKDQVIATVTAELTSAPSKKAVLFANGERELLTAKVKDLLAKIESYL